MAGFALPFVAQHSFPAKPDTTWNIMVWSAPLIAIIATILALQALLSAVITWTMGPARSTALIVILGVAAVLYAWWTGQP